MQKTVPTSLSLVLVVLLALVGCSTAPTATPGATPGATPTEQRTLTVFAAASLKGAFDEIATEFEAAHPGVRVAYSFDGSNTLVDQIAGGAPADVFASADEKNFTRATDAGLMQGPGTVFATNALALVVPAGNPGKITGLDASLDGKKLVVCAVGVPCGNATAALAQDVGIELKPVSQEQKVTDVLGKVTSGEADAGIVYATDATSAGDKVETLSLPKADAHLNRYPLGVTARATDAALAQQFVDHVAGDRGQAVLARFGFGKP